MSGQSKTSYTKPPTQKGLKTRETTKTTTKQVMIRMDWKRTVNQKGNIWYWKGTNPTNPLYLPKQWIHIAHSPSSIRRAGEKKYDWYVLAPERINPETVHGGYLFFRSQAEALKFAKNYMRTH